MASAENFRGGRFSPSTEATLFVTFEGYTTGDEIGWGDSSTVYLAEKEGARGGKPVAMKIRGFNEELEGLGWLEAARFQQKAAAEGCPAVAPVFATGTVKHSFYVVEPRYPRSALTLIRGKVTVRPEGVFALSKQVLQTLTTIRDKYGRAHGNLKPSNLLLDETGRLRESGIYLNDFSPTATQNHAADLYALGLVLYQLVRRREVEVFDWPIGPGAEWSNLGPKADSVRAFCNALLDPKLATLPDPIAAAAQALTNVDRIPGSTTGKSGAGKSAGLVVAALLAVAAVGAGGWWFMHRPPGAASHEPPAEEVAAPALTGDAWVLQLAEELQRTTPPQTNDLTLSEQIYAPLRKAGRHPAPEVIAQAKNSFATWGRRAVVDAAYDEFVAQGWTLPAGSLARLRGDLSSAQPVITQLTAIDKAAERVAAVRTKWEGLRETFARVEESGEPVLKGSPDFVKKEVAAAPDLDRLVLTLDQYNSRLTHLLELRTQADGARMGIEGRFSAYTGTVDSQTLRDWEAETRRFLPAPAEADRLRAEWAKQFDALEQKIPANSAAAPSLQGELAAARGEAENSSRGLLLLDVGRVGGAMRTRLAELEKKISATPTTAVAMVAPATPFPRVATSATPAPAIGNPVPPPPSNYVAPPTELPAAAGDREAFARMLVPLKALDTSRASAGTMKAARDQFLSDVRGSISPAYQKEQATFLQALQSIPFRDGGAAAPTIAGWAGPVPIAGGVAYTYAAKYRVELALVPGEGGRPPCFLASTELPLGLLFDWINDHGGNWSALEMRISAARGPRAWESRGAGLALRREWTWPTSMVGATFYPAPAKAPPPAPPTALVPMTYISSRSAALAAAQFGFRLPTVDEWQRALKMARSAGWETGEGNLRDSRWEKQHAHVAGVVQAAQAAGGVVRDPPWPDGDIFIPADQRSIPTGLAAKPARPGDDKYLWFAPVPPPGGGRLLNDLIGNVAEFAVETDGRAFVIGGSALSPPELDVATPYPLTAVQRNVGFSDVGLRLALSAGGGDSAERTQQGEALRKVLQSASAAP